MVTSKDLKNFAVSDKGLVAMKLEGTPTVLIVDDEELMREVTSIMIEENGGKVLTAVDGLDAVEVFAEHKGKIDLIFMDVSMPRMNGYEAFLEIEKIDPNVLVLIVSGLKMTPEVEALQRAGKVDFLSKPFHEIELIKALQKLQAKKSRG
ncbi:MAG: response regulator [Deltaproteobacteria bacterium]|nr:response regulator [Deltaproteobacteria bacterium]